MPHGNFAGGLVKPFTEDVVKKQVGVGLKLQRYPKAYNMLLEAHRTNKLGTIVPQHFASSAVTVLPESRLIWLIQELLAKPTEYTTESNYYLFCLLRFKC